MPDGSSPWLHRTGGGLEYAPPVSSELALAAAINYQPISVRDRAFTDNLESIRGFSRGEVSYGLGYGFGIHGTTPFGLLRLELGFNDQRGGALHFAIGDRF